MERKALYNSLRVHSRQNPKQKFPSWQVADYREMSTEKLFNELETLGIRIDRALFQSLSSEVDSPDELAESLYPEENESQDEQDRIYLCVFELWRRFVPERQTLGLLCDELDYQIESYDKGGQTSYEGLEDVLANLKTILDENLDSGGKPKELFAQVMQGCAHDLEGFIYDFIEKQIEIGNHRYAEDLLEAFSPYVIETNWFEFLTMRIVAEKEIEEAHRMLHQLIERAGSEKDVEFIFTLLFYAAEAGEESAFLKLLHLVVPLLETEEDFLDLLAAAEDFAHFKDVEDLERKIIEIGKQRACYPPDRPFSKDDPALAVLKQLLKEF